MRFFTLLQLRAESQCILIEAIPHPHSGRGIRSGRGLEKGVAFFESKEDL